MNRDHWTDRLSEYADGELTGDEREAVELHLLECTSCAEVLVELRQVVAEAGALEDREPAHDLWPGIERSLAPRESLLPAGAIDGRADVLDPAHYGTEPGEPRSPEVLSLHARRHGSWHRRVALTVPQLLAAGIALVLFSAGGVWMALAPDGAGASARPSNLAASAGTRAASQPIPVTYTVAYESAITELETEFEQLHERLDPETIRVVERNLAIIDAAIAEARQALESDPASGFLNNHLADAMRRKVDLLRQATRIERTEI